MKAIGPENSNGDVLKNIPKTKTKTKKIFDINCAKG
jgi:hypothetical protein